MMPNWQWSAMPEISVSDKQKLQNILYMQDKKFKTRFYEHRKGSSMVRANSVSQTCT